MTSRERGSSAVDTAGGSAAGTVEGCLPTIEALLTEIIDYAGLFPPATLTMADAVERYQRHREGEASWMLGRFVLPLARVDEFTATALAPAEGGDRPWRLSLLLPADVEPALSELERFTVRWEGVVRIESIEVAPLEPAAIPALRRRLPTGIATYFEIPWQQPDRAALLARLDAVASAGAAAKLRTGGVKPEVIPSPEAVARFLAGCAERGLRAKATAGLHHPWRARHPLTPAPDSAHAEMHGFLNLTLAAALLIRHQLPVEALSVVLESGGGELELAPDTVRWREWCLDVAELETARRDLFNSFGSCSFSEPVHDLKELGLL